MQVTIRITELTNMGIRKQTSPAPQILHLKYLIWKLKSWALVWCQHLVSNPYILAEASLFSHDVLGPIYIMFLAYVGGIYWDTFK